MTAVMMVHPRPLLVALVLQVLLGAPANAAAPAGPAGPVPLAAKTAGLTRQEGFLPLYFDPARGELLMEISRLGEEFLYGSSVAGGAGLTDVHLDRGQIGDLAVCRFQRVGPRVLLHQRQTTHRGTAADPAQRRAVEDSFPSAIRAALPIVAEERGRVLVDATELLLRDPQVALRLQRAGLGVVHQDRDRSVVLPEGSGAFPRNTEIEALLTFSTDQPARALAAVLPDEHTMTLRIHHSFLALPGPGYRPRLLDPRVGYIAVPYKDYTARYDEPLERQLASRWRLVRRDRGPGLSEPVQPLVLYLDRGIPEPERSTIRAAVLWWNQAFQAAGFRDAVRVRDLPEGASFLDVRYSGIAWVHRTERGWSSGEFQHDPRTGEILHAVVRLDSHRRRTVAQIYQNLQPAAARDRGCSAGDAPDLPLPGLSHLVLGRLAYLAAHEVGHVLGLFHNFAASVNGFGSVMDYYAPNVRLRDGALDLGDAYPRAVGPYDVMAIRWGYGEAAPPALEALVRAAQGQGLLPPPAGDPRWSEYDFGPDAVAGLRAAVAVRRVILDRFTADATPGVPPGELQARFSLAYLHHRHAIAAVQGQIGGQLQDPPPPGEPGRVRPVPAAQQRAALDALIAALAPDQLDVPERVAQLLLPAPADDVPAHHARFFGESGAVFSALAAARALAGVVVLPLLSPERAARLTLPGPAGALDLGEVLRRLVQATWGAAADAAPRQAALRRVAQRALLDGMIDLLGRAEAATEVRAEVRAHLVRLRQDLARRRAADPRTEAHLRLAEHDLGHALDRHERLHVHPVPAPPPVVRPIGG